MGIQGVKTTITRVKGGDNGYIIYQRIIYSVYRRKMIPPPLLLLCTDGDLLAIFSTSKLI